MLGPGHAVGDDVRQHYRTFVHDSARWDDFTLRDDDIVISPPPKCGTTWMQMICALLVFQAPTLERRLDQISPRLDALTSDRDDVLALLEAQQHRRFIKTHTPLDGLPYHDHVTYICIARDPRDVALSWDHHQANTDVAALRRARRAALGLPQLPLTAEAEPLAVPSDPHQRFWQWVDDPTPPTEAGSNLRAMLHHLDTFWQGRHRPNIVLCHFADLKADLSGEMRCLATKLGITVPDDLWPTLVDAATYDRMRERADELVPNATHGVFKDNRRFFHSGTSGQWRALLDDADLDRYNQRVAELASSGLAAWAHHGR